MRRGLVAIALLAAWPGLCRAAQFAPDQAQNHVGETATVCGTVASAKFLPNTKAQPTMLDLGQAYPNQVFTALIWGENRGQFGTPERSLMGKTLCVTGMIELFRGRAEIVLRNPTQLKVNP